MKSSTNGRKRINQADAAARRRLKRVCCNSCAYRLYTPSDHISKTISRAREGFEDDAENLAIAMIDEEVPADQKVFAARALIDATCILAGSINKLELPSSPISRCLAALYHLDPGFFIKHRHALQDRYMPSLPQFSSWIFNVLKVAANSDESKSIEMILVNAIRGIDLVRAYDPKSDDDGGILGSDAALKLATRIWLRQSQAQDGAVATNLFLRMLFPTKDGACPIPRSQSTIFKAASSIGLSAKVVIKLLLDRIRNAEERFILILPFTVPLPNDRSQLTTMQRAFADQRGVKIILKALRSIFVEIGFDFRSPDASRLTNMQGKAISEGVYVLNYLLTLWPGLVLLKKALNSGLLRVLAFCSVPCILSRLDENAGGHIHSIVSKTLLDSMVILRISKSARNAVTKCRVLKPCLDERSGCDKPVPPQLHKSEVWDAWALLFNSIRHHIKASEVFSSERKLEVVACGNVSEQILLAEKLTPNRLVHQASCLRKELRANFHKCAGCESVYFCSMPCHAAAWMLHCHKQMCMKYQNQRGESDSGR